MTSLALTLPVIGNPNSTEAPKIVTDFTSIQTWANGSIDATNLSAAAAQSAAINQAAQVVKGASLIASIESRTNIAYGTMPTPDQVSNIVLPAAGVIAVWFQATWQETVSLAARAAIFVGANQLKVATGSNTLAVQEATIGGTANSAVPLASGGWGIVSPGASTGYPADSTTGQIIGIAGGGLNAGGPCYIFAAAGTYTVSVQFKASSGNVVVSGRRLYAQALSFV